MHWDRHKAAFDLSVTVGFDRIKCLGITAEVQSFLLTTRRAKRAGHAFDAPVAEQRLIQAQHAIAVLALMVVEFLKADLHGLDLI
ncbi:hypothetical protein A9Q94_02285 [Rhodobacterales bacterium 56_14_T64]|nr:hypothetical protein A9Q94_02285 [Rhodobacterales bacterium 56_14_T64]